MTSCQRIIIAGFVLLTTGACTHLDGRPAGPYAAVNALPSVHQQAVVVVPDSPKATRARVSLWQRTAEGWLSVGRAMPAVVGRNGISPPGEKREGDGRTPSGVYDLKRAFGYAATANTGLLYQQATAVDFWVDDAASAQYNQWITGPPDAKSYEVLRRDDELYRQAVVVEYNTKHIIPGYGSAIFIHIWRDKKTPTAGCVALSQQNLQRILEWLQVNQNPAIILHYESS